MIHFFFTFSRFNIHMSHSGTWILSHMDVNVRSFFQVHVLERCAIHRHKVEENVVLLLY